MTVTPFLDGWTFRAADDLDALRVALPHDAMIEESRVPDAPSSYHGSYFPGGRYVYEKVWVPAASPRTALLFEGVYGDVQIILNGQKIAENSSPYREFIVELDQALREGANHLEVHVDNSMLPNSRWYTGSGIYRPVWLIQTETHHFARDGIAISTLTTAEDALIRVRTAVEARSHVDALVHVELSYENIVVAETTGPVGDVEISVPSARLWSAEAPNLYDATVTLLSGNTVLDSRHLKVGIRTVAVDAANGLLVNGRTVKLRGACIHHDSGILGAATHRAAEFRRARILKQNGYNAVRSSHNPLSRDLLDACDEIGLYVLDELTDVWFAPKTAHDRASDFESRWPDDLRSMVEKDRNHPSVIMYSIGNEIAEVGLPQGVDTVNRISALSRELDADRPTTVAANFLLAVLASRGKSMFQTDEKPLPKSTDKKPSKATSTFANVISNKIGSISQLVSKLPAADKATREAFPAVDVAGYNYAWSRYRSDAKRYPDRIVLGTESMPGDIAKIWKLVTELPNVIGDFTWTGWDYLGEAGLGTWAYGTEPASLTKPFPQVTSGCGTIDITGHPGVQTLLARSVWGQLDAPAIAVRPLNHANEKTIRTAWRFSDAIQSWSWRGKEGTLADIEVYSDAEYIELHLNERTVGRRKLVDHVAKFRVVYEPGVLKAVSFSGGRQIASSEVRTSQDARLTLDAESTMIAADARDLCFVRVEIRDDEGTVEMLADREVGLEVAGPAVLVGFGSAAPATTEKFTDATHKTYYGRALAVIRSTGEPGQITVTARSTSGEVATTTINATSRIDAGEAI